MNCRQIHLLLALAVISLVSLVALLGPAAAAASESQDVVDQAAASRGQIASARSRFTLPKLFDFEQYKALFKKTYHSLAEEMVRRKLMLARAFRAWISAIKYKYRKMNYYLGINEMSDWTPDELDMMENKEKLAGRPDMAQVVKVDDEVEQLNLLPQVDPSRIEEDLDQLAQDEQLVRLVDRELGNVQSGETRRRKRAAPARLVRTLTMDRLINTGAGVQLSHEAEERIDPNPESNNPDYEAPEMVSYGVREDYVEEIREFEIPLTKAAQAQAFDASKLGLSTNLPPSSASPANLIGSLMRSLTTYAGGQEAEQQQQQPLPDEMFFDHRDSGCMFLPRHQGKCGSCWAFTTIAFAEWLHCKATGKLVAFSEQYLVDCGKSAGANGCNGATEHASVKFIHNFGVELRKSYPYQARENQCPYDEHTYPKQMGYIRMEIGALLAIPVATFEKHLRFSPIAVGIRSKNFPGVFEYAGGVIEGVGCDRTATHSVLLVGHGREDGQEYWLIRNSWAIGWGDGGYMKMAKSCGELCFENGSGFIFGSANARKFISRPRSNERNNRTVVTNRYKETMLGQGGLGSLIGVSTNDLDRNH